MWKRIVKAPELYLVILICVCIAGIVRNNIYCDNVQLTRDSGTTQASFPINSKFDNNEYFTVSFNIKSPSGKKYSLQIIPDDCAESITINGYDFQIKNIAGRCDYTNGFTITAEMLQKLIAGNSTHYEFILKNHGGNGGLEIAILQEEQGGTLAIIALILCTLLAFFLCRRLKIPMGFAFILAIGVALRLHFSYSLPKYDKFGHDVDGHIAYIQYIAENKAIPHADDCWTCYHPPVYFTAMVPSWNLANVLHLQASTTIQWTSTLISALILLAGFFALQSILKGKALVLATTILAFWPTLILSAPRIGNDQLFYLLHLICLWGSLVYVQKRSGKHLFLAALATLFAYWTKSTAIVSIGIWLLALMIGYFPRGIKRPRKWEVAAFVTFGILLASIALRHVLSPSELIGNAHSLHGKLQVKNSLFHFIYFDIRSFIEYPFTSPWLDEQGRQFFWNYALKTALFGEFTLSRIPIAKTLATIISCSFLGSIIIAIRGLWNKAINKADLLLIAQGTAFFAALMFLRFKIPFSCSNDFRYIMPALLSFIPFLVHGATIKKASTKWKAASGICIATFVISSVALMLIVT